MNNSPSNMTKNAALLLFGSSVFSLTTLIFSPLQNQGGDIGALMDLMLFVLVATLIGAFFTGRSLLEEKKGAAISAIVIVFIILGVTNLLFSFDPLIQWTNVVFSLLVLICLYLGKEDLK